MILIWLMEIGTDRNCSTRFRPPVIIGGGIIISTQKTIPISMQIFYRRIGHTSIIIINRELKKYVAIRGTNEVLL